jgi:cytochrome c biogenesis protein CcmG/thiol:disulfide interchange protein DsbE
VTRYLVPLAGFLIISAFLALGLRLDPREVPSPLIDKPAPSFELPRLIAQGEVLAPRQLVGRVWLLNVWASWCVSCRAEHVLLNEIAQDRLVEIVGLNYKDTRADARAWLDQLGNPYTAIAVDTEGKVGIDWGVYGVPETFVIDAQGLIRYKHIGPLERAVLEQKILPLVRQLKRTSA